MSRKKRTPTEETVEAIKETALTGRPSSYRPEYAEQARNYCFLGATDAELSNFFHVSIQTIKNWQAKYPEFLASLKSGKEQADDRVERSLYQRAVGYEYDSVKIFNANGSPMIVPYKAVAQPDTTAMIFWLKNRRPERWRDVQKHEHGGPGDFDRMSDEQLREFVVEEAKSMRMPKRSNGTQH